MLAAVHSATLIGVDGQPVTVEVHVSSGLPAYQAYRASLVNQQTAESVTAAVKTAAYKKSFADIGSALSAATPAWAIQAA